LGEALKVKFKKYILPVFIFSLAAFLYGRWGYADDGLQRMTLREALLKFVAGNLAYQGGDYERAVTEYESVLRSGLENGALYYNLGNSYFKKNQQGKAVLNYERAKRFLPRDADLDFNYEYARTQARVTSFDGKKGIIAKLMDKHAAFYTEAEMAWAISALSFLVAALHLLSLYLKWPPRRRRGVLAVPAVCLAVFVLGFASKVHKEEGLAVAVSRTDARFEPRADATSHFVLGEGEKFKVLKIEEGWAKVERSDGKSGWVAQTAFEHI
jgi:tetratricopeptide (TPR) repeat protein